MRYILLLSALLLFAGCNSDDTDKMVVPKAQPAVPLDVITVTKERLPVWVEYTGMTKASSDQEVRARVSGRLEKIYFKDGQMVNKGDKLFLIEPAPYQAALDAAQAQKEKDEAALQLAKANVSRYKPLVDDGLAPRATLEEYEAQYNSYAAAIKADEAKITQARIDLDYTVVKAPVSGMVSARFVDVGNLVGYGEPTLLTKIVKIDPLYVYFSPSEAEWRLIRANATQTKMPAFAEVPATERFKEKRRLDGYVDFSNVSVDPTTSTVTMRATLDNPDHTIYPGTFVYVHVFVTDQKPYIMLPPNAIFEDQQGRFVYTVGEDGKVHRMSVKTGFTGRLFIVITDGLEPGMRVVVSGLAKVRDGMNAEPHDVTDTKGIAAVLRQHNMVPEAK